MAKDPERKHRGIHRIFLEDQGYARQRAVTDRRVLLESRATLNRETAEDLRVDAIERQERRELDPAYQAELERRPAIFFEQITLSPYAYPLDGQHYELHPGIGPTGLCPLCNNAEHRAMDERILEGSLTGSALEGFGFDRTVVIDHIVNHIGGIYAGTGEGIVHTLEMRSNIPLSGQDRPEAAAAVNGAFKRGIAIHKVALEDEHWDERHEGKCAFKEKPLVIDPDKDYSSDEDLSPSVFGRPAGARAKDWYAFNGIEQVGQLRPWGSTRMTTEIEKRKEDSLIFYDEQLAVRNKANRIYDEIMDGEGEAILDKSGDIVGYKEKNYSAALAAARLQSDVSMNLAKLAIIATKYEQEDGKMRRISPVLQGMIDDIGVFDRRELPAEQPGVTEVTAEVLVDELQMEFEALSGQGEPRVS